MSGAIGGMRVCQMVDRLVGGGQERVAVEIASMLSTRAAHSALLATRGGGDYESMLDGVDVFIGRRESRFDLRGWVPQVRWLRRRGFHIIHTHNPGSLAAVAKLKRLGLIRSAIVSHIQMLPPRELRYRAEAERWHRQFRDEVAASIVTNEGLKRYLIDDCGYPRDAVFLVPNSVDFDGWPEPDPAQNMPRIVMVAQWRAQKDHLTAIRAAAHLREMGIVANWLFVGEEDPSLVASARELIAQFELGSIVEIAGRRTDIPRLMSTSTVGVLATHFEGYPVALVEYAAAGLPIVVSDVEGTAQLVSPGDGIIGVPPADPLALARALAGLLERPVEARVLGQRARSLMRAECDSGVVADRIAAIYNRVLAGSIGVPLEVWSQ